MLKCVVSLGCYMNAKNKPGITLFHADHHPDDTDSFPS